LRASFDLEIFEKDRLGQTIRTWPDLIRLSQLQVAFKAGTFPISIFHTTSATTQLLAHHEAKGRNPSRGAAAHQEVQDL
jgi:hypothetical protein